MCWDYEAWMSSVQMHGTDTPKSRPAAGNCSTQCTPSCSKTLPSRSLAEYSRLFTIILCLSRSPASSWLQHMSTAPSMPMMVAIIPHPFFLLSSTVSSHPPEEDTKLPRYLVDGQSFMGSRCTFSTGHGTLHLFGFPTWTTTNFSADSFSRWVSIKEFMAAFLRMTALPHSDTPRVSSINPSIPIGCLVHPVHACCAF